MISDYSICLMYHCLYEGEHEYRKLHPDDRPYSLSTSQFRKQLLLLKDKGILVLDAQQTAQNPREELCKKHTVLLTFDDGHKSFHRHALPILAEYGHTSFMFLTTDKIGTDANFLNWKEVSELHANGHVMGGHGSSHRFLDEINSTEAEKEMRVSRELIEIHTESPCTTMSFPGGRYNSNNLAIAGKLGYETLFTSEIRGPLFQHNPMLIGRYAIRHNVSMEEFSRMISGDRHYAIRKRGVQIAKKGLRRMLGNKGYHRLYQKLAKRD